MKLVLTTLNAKFIHTSLALRYLHAYCSNRGYTIELQEYNINQHTDDIVAELFREKADIIGFACYIWNIEAVLNIVRMLKIVSPQVRILLGGPEVSFDPVSILTENPAVDMIIAGEGEMTLHHLMETLTTGGDMSKVPGVAYRVGSVIQSNPERELMANLDSIPWPYVDMDTLGDRIIYYECTRGCPFNCQYCLSSTTQGVRFFSLERVKQDLMCFIQAGVKQVKFVDRTFNCNRMYALEIFRFLAGQAGRTNFHFEIAADLLDEETLDFLATVPPGRFQFEIGVQSTHEPTLELIQRKMDWAKVQYTVEKLARQGNIHLHLDLIAGLPGESYTRFAKSFDDVFALLPGRLQLGFLKLLKGSGVRERADEFQYVYMDIPPYEVLGNIDISYEELLQLKRVEDMLEKYPNSHKFSAALGYILAHHTCSPFALLADLAQYWEQAGLHRMAHRQKELYRILADYYEHRGWPDQHVFLELLKFDYLREERALQLPEFFVKHEVVDYQQRFYTFLGDPAMVQTYLPQYCGMTARDISKRVQIETFAYDVMALARDPLLPPNQEMTTVLFQYENRDRLYNRAAYVKIEI